MDKLIIIDMEWLLLVKAMWLEYIPMHFEFKLHQIDPFEETWALYVGEAA